jgi:CRISPR/Cas system-associated endonuclease Cas3-HD
MKQLKSTRRLALKQERNLKQPRPEKADETAEEYKTRRTEARAQLEANTGKVSKKDITKCLQKVIEVVSPYKVLQKQKKYMRRYMRKPRDMTIRQFVNSVTRMNNNELPHLP